MYCQLYTREEGRFFFNSHFADSPLQQKSLFTRSRRQNEQHYRSPRLPPFFSASIREGRVALSVGHPRGTHSHYVIGCCLIPLGICGLKNNSRRITYRIGCVWGMPSLSPLSSLDLNNDHTCISAFEFPFFLLHRCEVPAMHDPISPIIKLH